MPFHRIKTAERPFDGTLLKTNVISPKGHITGCVQTFELNK